MFASIWNTNKILATTIAVLLISACGSSSNKNAPPPPPPANVAPTADAGVDQSVDEGAAVSLPGAGTDTDGTIASYAWTQTSGADAGAITDADMANASFTAPMLVATEDLVFTLTVTDDDGATGADTVTITVNNVNAAPAADAGVDQVVDSNDLVTLDGSASADADGTVDVYTWTQTAGAAVVLDETVPAMPTFTAPNVGADEVLTFELVVTDNEAAMSAADAVNVTINPTLPLPFTDNFGDGNANGWTTFDDSIQNGPALWNVASGRYVQTVDTNTFGGDVDETYRRGTYAYLTDSVDLTDYRFTVEASRIAGSSDDIGVMFRYTDNDNYYRLSINSESGSSRLESKVNGTFMTLGRNFRGYDGNQFIFDITVEVEGPLIQVFVNNDPLFSASSTDHASGGVALYGRDGIRFDNISVAVNNTAPEIVISSPVAYTVIPGGPRDVSVSAVARNVPAGGSVDFMVDMVPGTCTAATEAPTGVFSATCANVAIGNRLIRANLRDAPMGAVLDFDNNSDVAVGAVGVGDKYDAIGDSITLGLMDNYRRDNLSLTDQRTIGFQGWAGVLGDLLTTANGQFNLVGNEGIPGDQASTTRFTRLNSILERNPDSNRALVMLGTNDTNAFPAPTSAIDLIGHLDNIAGRLLNTGAGIRDRDVVYIASLPPVFGAALDTPYPDPFDPSATRNQLIMDYNAAIQAEAWRAGVELGPDFFTCFLTPTVNRFSLFKDSLHPNGLGHAMMAAIWADWLTGGAVPLPLASCPSPIFILEGLDAYTHGLKQNLLEPGDEYYNDEAFTLTNVPAELADGVWVTQSNADNGDISADFMSFDTGTAPVTVYIAYDPAGEPPTSSTHTFAAPAIPLASALTVSDPAVGTFSIVSATTAAGTETVTIGGTASDMTTVTAQQGYIVIVVP